MSRLAHGVLLPGFPGTHVPPWLATAVADGLAGVCLFAENTPDLLTTRQLTDAVRAARAGARLPGATLAGAALPGPVVAIDEEGGNVTRLQATAGSALPGNAALGAVDDLELTTRCAERLGALLALAGIDLDLAPCLDVASEPRNPVIGVRSFGPHPDVVLRHGRAFAVGLARAGVACCGKHYPGHGATTYDSHVDLPVLSSSEATLRERDEAPFLALLGDLDAVMTGHLVARARGAAAASLSRWATDRLRAAGFTGAVVTDALGMRAITDRMGLGEACVRALEAGADLLCLDAPHQRDAEATFAEAVTAVTDALAAGRLDPAALARSAARNAALSRVAVSPMATPEPGASAAAMDAFDDAATAAEQALAGAGAEAAERALQVRGPVRLSGPPLVLDVRRLPSPAAGRTTAAFELAVRRRWVAAEIVVPLDPAEIAETLDVAPVGHDVVLITRAARADAAEEAALAAVLGARRDALVVHTGVLAAAPDVPRLACTLGEGAANAEALVRYLAADGGDGPAAPRPEEAR